MSIILRTLKGSALTYEEMDRNLSQYFYSSSVHDSGTELRLHYTGSDSLDTATEDYGPDRYHAVNIGSGGSIGGVTKIIAGTGVTISPVSGVGNVTINASGAAGNNPGGSVGSIQYKVDGTTFGGNTDLFYNSTNYRVGLGTTTPSAKLHIAGSKDKGNAVIRLAGIDGAETAQVEFYEGTTALGRIGRTLTGTDDSIFINAKTKLKFSINSEDTTVGTVTSTGLGIFETDINGPNRQLVVVGTSGIGIQRTGGARKTQSIIRPIVNDVFIRKVLGSNPEPYGLMLSGPLANSTINNAGGHVVVSLSEYTGGGKASGTSKNSFTIISSTNENYLNASSVATFRSDGKVGINLDTNTDPDTTLHVNGQIRGKYENHATDETDLNLHLYKVSKLPITGTVTVNSATGSAVPGMEATLLVDGPGGEKSVLFNSSHFVVEDRLNVINFRSITFAAIEDNAGNVKWYETGRTAELS